MTKTIETHPLTPDRWNDLAALFETNSVTRNCWCMWFKIVQKADVPPGIIAYVDGTPAGWCAVAPRDDYPRITRSRTLKPVDDKPAWSIVCFFIAKDARGVGLSRTLLDAAIGFAKQHDAKLLEGYPVDPSLGPVTADEAYHGLQPQFENAGFKEAIRRGPKRPIMRKRV